jgi:hypothetical protein
MRRLVVGIILGLLGSVAGVLFTVSPAAACGMYFSVDEIPAGAAYTAYYIDEGWEYWDAAGPFWVYVVDPLPGMYCGT